MVLSAKQTTKNTRWLQSLGHALRGVGTVILTERNARFELVTAVVGIVFGLWLRLDVGRWLAFGATCAAVLATEALNTAVEAAVDLASGGQYTAAGRRAKDCAAGAVLLMSIAAVLIGLWIFGPALLAKLS